MPVFGLFSSEKRSSSEQCGVCVRYLETSVTRSALRCCGGSALRCRARASPSRGLPPLAEPRLGEPPRPRSQRSGRSLLFGGGNQHSRVEDHAFVVELIRHSSERRARLQQAFGPAASGVEQLEDLFALRRRHLGGVVERRISDVASAARGTCHPGRLRPARVCGCLPRCVASAAGHTIASVFVGRTPVSGLRSGVVR